MGHWNLVHIGPKYRSGPNKVMGLRPDADLFCNLWYRQNGNRVLAGSFDVRIFGCVLVVHRISNYSEGLFAPAIAPSDFLQIPALKDMWFLLWEKMVCMIE